MLKFIRFKAILVATNKLKYYVLKIFKNYFICKMLLLSLIINNIWFLLTFVTLFKSIRD